MSSVAVKENQGVCAVRKNSSSDESCDIFSLEQLTGRPSILRQSQADNINKAVLKGAKVCFQTPRRDPVTKRIMSPSRTSGTNSQDDSTKALETFMPFTDQSSLLNNISTTLVSMQSNSVSLHDDDIPIQSKVAYTLDLDNLDAINPFQSSIKMANSPPKPPTLPMSWASELIESDKTTAIACTPKDDQMNLEVIDTPLDETLPFVSSVENSLVDNSDNISSAEGTIIIKTNNNEKSITDTDESDITEPIQESKLIAVTEDQIKDSPLPTAGSYNLDFDNLEMLDPFQIGGSKIPNSPMLSKAEGVPDPPQTFEEATLEPSEEAATLEPSEEAATLEPSEEAATLEPSEEAATLEPSEEAATLEPSEEAATLEPSEEAATLEPSEEAATREPSKEVAKEQDISPHTFPSVSEAPSPPEEKSTVTEFSRSTTSPKENPMLLEFNFNDGAEVKCKPPPKRLGVKRPAGTKAVSKKTDTVVKERKESELKQLSPKNLETEPVDVPPIKGSYMFDFDDPNFNPFGTKAKMGNSPPRGIQTSPVSMESALPVEKRMSHPRQEQSETVVQDEVAKPRSPRAVSVNNEKVEETTFSVNMQQAEDAEASIPSAVSHINIPQSPAIHEPEPEATTESRTDLQNQTFDLVVVTPSEDEFVPGAFFMSGGDFDGQFDYLEQFGSNNFKESALRKQSLYLKFDPLMKESPKKTTTENGGFSMPRPSLAIRMMEAAKSEGKQKSQCNNMKLLCDLPPPVVNNVVPDPTVLDLLVPTLKEPVKMEDSIIEVLKYSQRDMDASLQRAEKQAEERQQQMSAKIETLSLENQQMMFILSEFEATITQITDGHKQKEDRAKIELELALQEKDQLAKDLTDLERSFSSVVKRLDRCKEVIEGFKKNEETLKQYAQNCMDRLQKEEKRYQALKAHAEEKLDHANKAIADVRTRTGAEVATLQVQLKREHLKVQSLENDLEQKAKEVKDVTELCDELLLKVQKHGF
ncbi:transforming acidic coiled-coil-containing protein 3 [Triplophysa dalaica]|uniref:transforming acidic coiled-coil-containing protein 3 n=1 Tax=Triplophysa dalaica TaxID=1582913 RepID=UPI0024DF3FF2|nr:transforming acidic coiled-coil-containing protein 3 [Triplophysa dalaica]XP_056616482.1 transforming acidic coiled-coil-containing protein 3 [Triplophysa dalaica]XP_056616483.1 transforming acidic coiled-coil-containing protein 3 [Triplophysa dalaica]XP_056616484.1 transforming acidic coiled-coil-containing protein 3 [Triplophysa dalaica]